MKSFVSVALSIFMFVTVSSAFPQDAAKLDSKILQLKEAIEAQLEKIKAAKEKSGEEISLAKLRIAEQLRKSQETLMQQVEILERFRTDLSDQIKQANDIVADTGKNWRSSLEKAFNDIDGQINSTSGLIKQMESMRDDIGDNPGQEKLSFPDLNLPMSTTPTYTPPQQLSTQTNPIAPYG